METNNSPCQYVNTKYANEHFVLFGFSGYTQLIRHLIGEDNFIYLVIATDCSIPPPLLLSNELFV